MDLTTGLIFFLAGIGVGAFFGCIVLALWIVSSLGDPR